MYVYRRILETEKVGNIFISRGAFEPMKIKKLNIKIENKLGVEDIFRCIINIYYRYAARAGP